MFLVFLLFANILSTLAASGCDSVYSIQSVQDPKLVVDASDPDQMRLQIYNGTAKQLWRFECGRKAGLFYIVSEDNDERFVLDFTSNSDGIYPLILERRTDSLNQQWILNADSRIVNAGSGYNFDVYHSNFTSGNPVNVWKTDGKIAQEFFLQEVTAKNKEKC